MNAPLTVRTEPTVAARKQAERAPVRMETAPGQARMQPASKPAEAAPRYDFVGIAG